MSKRQSKIRTGRKAISPERAQMYRERREAKRERTAYLRNARIAKQVRATEGCLGGPVGRRPGKIVLPGL